MKWTFFCYSCSNQQEGSIDRFPENKWRCAYTDYHPPKKCFKCGKTKFVPYESDTEYSILLREKELRKLGKMK